MEVIVEPDLVIAKLKAMIADLSYQVALRDAAIDQLQRLQMIEPRGTANGHVHVENRDPMLTRDTAYEDSLRER